MRSFTQLPPLSLYVHLPWCIRKCPYCDFNSHQQKNSLPERKYVDALLADLEQEIPDIWGRSLESVFIGGGTPSLFSASELDRLLCGIRALTALAPTAEITLEANPGTFEQEKFRDFRAIGINRLSIGIQSFNDNLLRALGRVHCGSEACRAVDIGTAAGFDEINLDLMFGLPGQSLAESRADLSQAISLQPTHLSFYELTLEPNTRFAKFPPELPPEDSCWEMQTRAIELLAEHGYARYEISAYAKPRHQCRHNRNYWLFGDYVGIGAGAHGKLSFADRGEIRRRWKVKHPDAYLQSAHSIDRIGGESVVPFEDTALEFMMNALRLVEGFPVALFQTHTGVSLKPWQDAIEAAQTAGLLEQQGFSLRATERGLSFLNDVVGHFLPASTTRNYPVIPILRS